MKKHEQARRRRTQWIWTIAAGATCAVGAAVWFVVHSGRATPVQATATVASESAAPVAEHFKAPIPYADAQPIIEAHRSQLPAELAGKTPDELAAAWPRWVSSEDAAIRARLDRGDEDSLVNFWLYGTTFTSRPRATERDLEKLGNPTSMAQLLEDRLNDLVAGLAAPGANERLQFGREILNRHNIDPATPRGKDQAHDYLIDLRARALAETDKYRRGAQSAQQLADPEDRRNAFATLYHERGLSSDTRINADFAIDQALQSAKSKGILRPGTVVRVAIVGPGLDFTDKAEGYDFYPQQTIQPFAVMDSLLRLGMADSSSLRVTTLDLSPRINQHLRIARERASYGLVYVVQLPLERDQPSHQWVPDLVAYWQHFGAAIGHDVPPLPAPPGAASVQMRAVTVPPTVVTAIVPRDVNIVLERLDPLRDADRFDLIIATNILVYYDAFEQALALANVARMLRPGGLFLTNYVVSPALPMESAASLTAQVYFDRQRNGDTLFGYRRK